MKVTKISFENSYLPAGSCCDPQALPKPAADFRAASSTANHRLRMMRLSRRFFAAFFTSTTWWLGVAISLMLFALTSRMVEDKAAAKFAYHAANAEVAIQARIRSYTDVLRGVSALFSTHHHVTRDKFRAYVNQLELESGFPGIRNINFAPRVYASERDAFIATVRADTSVHAQGYPEFTIKPPGERPEHHVLTYQEPMEKNMGTFGFDMASWPDVKKALDHSRDTGQLSASGRLIRINGPNKHVGLAMRLPLYRPGMPLDTVEQRRAAYYGSVGAGFDVSQLMLGAIDRETLQILRLKLYDTGSSIEQRAFGTVDPARLLFDSAGNAAEPDTQQLAPNEHYIKRSQLEIGSRVWEAEFSADKGAMLDAFDSLLPWVVLAIGLTGSLLFYGIFYSLTSARIRAVEIANDMTKDLRASEASLAEAQHMAQLGSWLLEAASGAMYWSAETYRIFGLERTHRTSYDDFIGRIHDDDRSPVKDGIARTLDSGMEFSTEHRIVRHDGAVRWVQTITRPSVNPEDMRLRGTIMDITERKNTVEALRQSQDLLRELTAHQDRVKEDERKRIAREIHDELGQTLLALRIDVAMLEARTGRSHPRLNQKVRAVLAHIDATVKTIRTIINNLRPAVLDLGLTAAIEWQVAEFQRRSAIECELVISELDVYIDDALATTLFRVLQESLTNVLRHAGATRVVIELYCEDDRLVMRIADNGVGFPNSRRKANSFGLIGVEERIHALNGECRIRSVQGKGTTLAIYIPVARTETVLAPTGS